MSDVIRVTNLRCEYHPNPLGIDVIAPRLSWQLQTDRPGARQTAYHVIAAASKTDLQAKRNLLWDSGKVTSGQSVHVVYGGPRLESRQRVWWRVRVWDETGKPSAYSKMTWWEMGLLDHADWQAQWIGASLVGGPRTPIPCPYLRKAFSLAQPAAAARLYVTALGLYECTLNGRRVGDAELTPGWTDFRHRVRYQTYDVTALLRQGPNTLGAILGDGWYCGNLEWRGRQFYGDRPLLFAQLEMTLADGSRQVVVSDGMWETAFGPLLEADLIMGESYDARLELADLELPIPSREEGPRVMGKWQPVEMFPHPDGLVLVAQNGPLVRRQEELEPIAEPSEIKGWPLSNWIFDLGQNMVGRARLKVKGERGTTIRLRFGEMLNPDGTLYTANLRTARQVDYYTLKGEGIEVYEPRFTFHGFRYVEVYGYPGVPPRDAITGVVLHSDNPPVGTFECSDPLVNQLQHNIRWGWKGNSVDVPTDCPQRDERLGWTGDAQVFCRTAAFITNAAPFFAKWTQDLEDAQAPSGAIPMVAPTTEIGGVEDGGPAWADAAVIVPWMIYLYYGDARLLQERYGMMSRFVDFLIATSPGLIRVDQVVDHWAGVDEWLWGGFGDWLALDGSGRNDGGTPKDLIGTAFLAHSARLMSRIAAVLGKGADADRYARLYEDARAAFRRRFVTPDGLVAGGTQTGYVLALAFDLLPQEARQRAAIALVRDIRKREMHLATGFVGTPFLPFVLTEIGHDDVAYALLAQKTWPSWLYAVTQGATTIWERWDGWTHDRGFQDPGMNSFNHYAYGAIGAWLYAVVAGIDADPDRPGYRHIIFRPRPGGGLTYAKASLESMYGTIVSDWRIEDGRFEWDVVVPPNTTATVILPGEAEGREVESGKYHFSVETP